MSIHPTYINPTVPNNAPSITDDSIVPYKLISNSDYKIEYHESKIFVQDIHLKNFESAVIFPYLETCNGDIILNKADQFSAASLRTAGNMYMPKITVLSIPYLIQCRGDMFFGKIDKFESYRLKAVKTLIVPHAHEIVLTRLIYGDIYALRAKKIFLNSDFTGNVHCMNDAEVIGMNAEKGKVKRFLTHVDAMRYSLNFFER